MVADANKSLMLRIFGSLVATLRDDDEEEVLCERFRDPCLTKTALATAFVLARRLMEATRSLLFFALALASTIGLGYTAAFVTLGSSVSDKIRTPYLT